MRAIVTGAGGFIASHVVEELLRAGWEVTALVHYNSRGQWGHLEASPERNCERLSVVLGDIGDRGQMQDLIREGDTVLHLAALIGIPYSYLAPASYVQTNVIGTLNILESARLKNARRIIVTSTSEVYGTARYAPIDEVHPLQAQSPYAATKIAADKLAESYYRSFDVPVVILRPFNTYGPRQSARAFIPSILVQALRGSAQIELGNLEPRRDLTFVSDTARAFMLSATINRPIEGEVIHFGQGNAIGMSDLARACLKAVGVEAEIIVSRERQRPLNSEVELLLCNAEKAHRLLGWYPEVPLEEGLERTARYLRLHLDAYRAEGYIV